LIWPLTLESSGIHEAVKRAAKNKELEEEMLRGMQHLFFWAVKMTATEILIYSELTDGRTDGRT